MHSGGSILRPNSLTGIVIGFYSLFGTGIVLTRAFTGWSPAQIGGYLAVGFGAGAFGAFAGWLVSIAGARPRP